MFVYVALSSPPPLMFRQQEKIMKPSVHTVKMSTKNGIYKGVFFIYILMLRYIVRVLKLSPVKAPEFKLVDYSPEIRNLEFRVIPCCDKP